MATLTPWRSHASLAISGREHDMRSQRITTENLDLAPVFGQLTNTGRENVLTRLAEAERKLLELRDELTERTGQRWQSAGVQLDTYPSGQASISGYVEDGELTFAVELRPRNFYAETAWQPGDAPREMATDAWEVDATVYVVSDAAVDTGQQTATETAPRQETRPEDAAAALCDVCIELRRLARSRPTEASAWRSPTAS